MTFQEAIDSLYQIRHITGSQCTTNLSEFARAITVICNMHQIEKDDFINKMISEIYIKDKLKKFNWLWD